MHIPADNLAHFYRALEKTSGKYADCEGRKTIRSNAKMNREAICLQLTSQIKRLIDKQNNPTNCCRIFACSYGTQPGTWTPGDVSAGHRFLFSGHKIGYINERVFRYDTNEYCC